MFGIVHYEMFIIAGIILNITPGSDTIYILSRSISQGRGAGIYSVLGISSGCAVHTLLAALGLSVILAQSALAFTIVKTAGALYLGYLGVTTLLAKNNALVSLNENVMSNRDIYLQGLITNVLNPKVALFFLSFLPQFIDPQNSYGIIPFIFLGLTFLITGTLWCLILVFCSSGVTTLLRQKNNAANWMNKICGGVYLLLGVKLLTTER
ncbi:LysE family translocator [Sporomusa sp.]|uniref:LysE family translocator n=1 Tax=Sporomusa sp. TaxID=2078658 RepID=UPI002B8EF95E|nr:LysE family translocator [Sporomusa sp.]HWR44236.1 LysE family translocator [Sporomusa sp.]